KLEFVVNPIEETEGSTYYDMNAVATSSSPQGAVDIYVSTMADLHDHCAQSIAPAGSTQGPFLVNSGTDFKKFSTKYVYTYKGLNSDDECEDPSNTFYPYLYSRTPLSCPAGFRI